MSKGLPPQVLRGIKTKVVGTLGPSCSGEAVLRELIEAGLDCCRINFSHGTHEQHKSTFEMVRKLSEEYDHHVGVLIDIQGPKIRTGVIKEAFEVPAGSQITVTSDECVGDKDRFQIDYPGICDDLSVGDVIFINDGIIRLRVVSKGKDLRCQVEASGVLSSKKGCNIPSGNLKVALPTAKDLIDLKLVAQLRPDVVAVSFVGGAQDLRDVRKVLAAQGFPRAKLCAKIERRAALERLEEIIEEADSVMVARGDLGVEIDSWEVPSYQRHILELCNANAKPVIVATQMLESMTVSARPTRAEVSDVFESVVQGADAVMLSGETSVGAHPRLAIEMMDRIAGHAEQHVRPREARASPASLAGCLSSGLRDVTERLIARGRRCAVLTASRTGDTARLLSSLRLPVPIFAFSGDPSVIRQMSVVWGVSGVFIPHLSASMAEQDYFTAVRQVLQRGLITSDHVALVVSASQALPAGQGVKLSLYEVKSILDNKS